LTETSAPIQRKSSLAPVPTPCSYWVVEHRLLAGEYPSRKDTAEAKERLRQMVEFGVTRFVDLTEEDEGLFPYAQLLDEITATHEKTPGRQVEHARFPIEDLGVPSIEAMQRILENIDTALAAGQVVYLHCLGGVGRTGTVVGCYLVRHGLSGDQALAKVTELFSTTPKYERPSPEMPEQLEMVRHWRDEETL